MAQIYWKSQVSADFNTTGDWSTGAVPGPADDAILDASGATPYTVSTSTAETVNSIQLASTATFSINARTFTASAGTGSGANAGTIQVDNNAFFALGGGVNNTGAITLNSLGNTTEMTLNANTTFSGGGQVTLSNFSTNYVFGAVATDTLTNVNNTISGAGQLGDGQMTLVNKTKGVINATGTVALNLDTAGETATNSGLLEATGTGGLTIHSTTVNNSSGGVIQANTGSAVSLQSADILGGTFKTVGTGVIQVVDRGVTIDGTTSAVNNTGVLNIVNNEFGTIIGMINNTGSINLNSLGNTTELVVGSSGVDLIGGGKVNLTDLGTNYIFGAAAADTLTNFNNTISGLGFLGDAQMTLVNQAAGVIDATGAGTALTVDTQGETVTNSGLIEGTGTAGLRILNTAVNDSTGGVILAATGSSVNLQSADIIGGTLTTSGTGVIQAVDRGSVLDGATSAITNNATVNIVNNEFLTVQGTITNSKSASINLNSGGNTTELIVGAPGVTLTGGVVVLTDFAANYILGTLSGPGGSQTVSTLTNTTTISGSGSIGASELSLVNSGTVDATGANALIIDTGGGNIAGSNTVANTGLLEATNPGALKTTGGMDLRGVEVSNGSTGIVEANGAATHVDLQSATISGGKLVTANGGVIETAGSDRGSLLDGTTNAVNNTGVLNITNNAWLYLQGTINNTGSINLQSGGNDTRLRMNGNTVLTGGGPITLTDNANNTIDALSASTSLTNVSSTISGSGTIDGLILINDAAGVIDATGSAASLIINTSTDTVTNLGLIEATGAAGMVIDGATIANAGGTISAGTGSVVNLQSADIQGGTIATSGTGVIETAGSDRGSVLDGTTNAVNNSGVLNITNNAWLYLQGTFNNTGSIHLQSGGNDTRLRMNGNTVLTGGGPITLTDNANNTIDAVSASTSLTNVSSTISGSGTIDGLILINDAAGVIDATGSAASLIISTGSDTVTNSGLIEGAGAAGLTIQSTTVNGSTGGTITAGTGSSVNLQSADIVGGTLSTAGTGAVQAIDRGSLIDGTTSTVNNTGALNIVNNDWLTIQGSIHNTGTISVNGTGNDTRLIIGASTTLTGAGSVNLLANTANIISASSAVTLTNDGNTISGNGNFFFGSITLVNLAGTIDADGPNTTVLPTTGGVFTNDGTLEGTGAGGLSIQNAAVTQSSTGTIFAGAGSGVTLQATSVTGGTMATAAGGTITIGNGSTFTGGGGTIADAGTIALQSSGTSTGITFNANETLAGGGSVTLSANKNNVITATKATIVVTNDDTIAGGGSLGGGKMTLINGATGVIDADSKVALIISTGATTITNNGLIESTGTGKGEIKSSIVNNGTLEANGGLLALGGVVTGSAVTIAAGTLYIANGGAAENVTFTGKTGKLELAQSQTYTGDVTGFSLTGKTSFDLKDIAFVSPTEATYSGTTSSGVLTVTDGIHTTHINMIGNYTNSTFVASSDGHGGTKVVDPSSGGDVTAAAPAAPRPSSPLAPVHHFVATMAGLTAGSVVGMHAAVETWRAPASMLVAPRIHIA